jgi:hypothetical protein
MTRFYLGAHRPHWTSDSRNPPQCISFRSLARYAWNSRKFPTGSTSWILDSGAYTELIRYGTWNVDADDYGGAVYRFLGEGWPPDFAAPQDWCCEPTAVRATGMSVRLHQEFTIDSVQYLREEFPHAPWIPVLQGFRVEEYLDHVAMYAARGIDLAQEHVVGLGSVCKRENTNEIGAIVTTLHSMGIKLHGFGVKRGGLIRYGHLLASADSMAWSAGARRSRIRVDDDCPHPGDCRNCLRYALRWREQTVRAMAGGQPQLELGLNFTGGQDLTTVPAHARRDDDLDYLGATA